MIYYDQQHDIAFKTPEAMTAYNALRDSGATKKELREFREQNADKIDEDFE